MDKLLIICGPTATGKTALALELAKKFSGEIISADSRQVYKGMDIGTGKDLPKFSIFNFQFSIDNKQIGYHLLNSVPLWLLDVLAPNYQFTVADYVECANLVVKDIWQRGKLPIFVGGTGFYIKGIVDGIGTLGIEPNWRLRKKLSSLSIDQLRVLLERTYPKRWRRMNGSDRKNPRRLIRAIEIAIEMKKEKIKKKNDKEKSKSFNLLMIGVYASYNNLYQRIDERVEKRIRQGAEKEAGKLLRRGYHWNSSALGTTIGYQEWRLYFEKKSSLEEVVQKWKFAEHAYARRQLTWFKKDKRVNWFDIANPNFVNDIEKLVNTWYNNSD